VFILKVDLAYSLCQVWDEGAYLRAEVKATAKGLVGSYYRLTLAPPGVSDAAKLAHEMEIRRRVAVLLDDANFLKNGRDDDVRFTVIVIHY
jgi:hypothetical protein